MTTHAISRLRSVNDYHLERFATIVPAIPDDSTWVVLTGDPKWSAAPIVAIAVIPAAPGA